MLVLTTKDILYKFDMLPIPGNTILEVKEDGIARYRVTRGIYERVEIDANKCVLYGQEALVYHESHQELLQRREEVAELMRQVKVGAEREKRNYADYMRHFTELEEEKSALLLQIERAVDEHPKLVELPMEVFEALRFFKNSPKGVYTNWTNQLIVECVLQPGSYHQDYEEHLAILRRLPFNTLLSALVNGYTVETAETLESKIKVGVRGIFAEWRSEEMSEKEQHEFRLEDEHDDLAQRITEFVTQVFREDGVQQNSDT